MGTTRTTVNIDKLPVIIDGDEYDSVKSFNFHSFKLRGTGIHSKCQYIIRKSFQIRTTKQSFIKETKAKVEFKKSFHYTVFNIFDDNGRKHVLEVPTENKKLVKNIIRKSEMKNLLVNRICIFEKIIK